MTNTPQTNLTELSIIVKFSLFCAQILSSEEKFILEVFVYGGPRFHGDVDSLELVVLVVK